MAPGSIFHHISFRSTILVSYLLSFAIFYFPFHKPKILLYRLSIPIRSHFVNIREGIDNPFVTLVASWCWFVQVFGGLLRSVPLDWYLGSQNWGKYLRSFAASPFPLQGKTNACSRGSKKDFWRPCWGDLRQVKTYQVPIINSHLSHYIIFHLPLFSSPPLLKWFSRRSTFSLPLFRSPS